MKAYLPFILAGAAGLMLRTALSALAGQPYTMDGHDIYNALVCLLICYWLRVLIRAAREERPEQSRSRGKSRGRRGTACAAHKDKAA